MMTEKQNRLLGVCASLGLHGLAAALLVFTLSGNMMMPRDLGKLDFVWVSLASRGNAPALSAVKDRGMKKASAEPLAASVSGVPASVGVRTEAKKPAAESSAAAGDGPAPSASKTVAYAAAGIHSPVSDAGRAGAVSGTVPALSNAYPLYRENPPPGYPELAREQGYEGVVLVAAEILADGRVGKALVSKSSGYAILDQSAVKAVKKWKFEPAKKAGVPCKTWAELPIKFVIDDHHSQS